MSLYAFFCAEVMTHIPQIVIFTTLEKGMEHKGEQKLQLWFNHNASIAVAVVGEKARHGMKQLQTAMNSNLYYICLKTKLVSQSAI